MLPDRATRAGGMERLQSWKEIASYLGVGVRTAQVWERERGLPVHRLPGARGPVSADAVELEAWRRSSSVPPPLPPAGHRVARLVFAGVGVMVLAVVFVGYRSRAHDVLGTRDATLAVVPLTADVGVERAPDLSADGSQVVFVATHDGASDVITQVVATNARHVLAKGVLAGCFPRWSPDGRMVAFFRERPAGIALALLPVRGGPERVITGLPGADRAANPLDTLSLSWTHDGRGIVVADRRLPGLPFQLVLIAVGTGARTPLTTPPSGTGGDTQSAFSPDGTRLAFVRHTSYSEADLFIMPAQGGTPMRLTTDATRIEGLAWQPDSQSLVFASPRGMGRTSLWRLNINHPSNPVRVSSGEGNVHYPTIAPIPTGARLVYELQVRDVNIWSMPLDQHGSSHPVVASTWLDHNPAVSPDGRRLAFISKRTGNTEVWIANADGTHPVQVTALGGPYTDSPRWSPDGRTIAFTSHHDGNRSVYTISMTGGSPHRITTDAAEEGRPSWSHDGQWLYFRSHRSGTDQVWTQRHTHPGVARQITRNGGYEALESPNATMLYYVKDRDEPGLWQVPIAGGTEERIIEGVREGQWAVTRTSVVFRVGTAIQSYDPATRHTRTVGAIPTGKELTAGFAVSLDGTTVFWPQVDQDMADLLRADLH
jgi:Tol biopolymer transport system component